MNVHQLKTHPGPFAAVIDGSKRYEIRSPRDRNFEAGDLVFLCEWDTTKAPEIIGCLEKELGIEPKVIGYTGEWLAVIITHVTPPGIFGLPDNLCVFSFADVDGGAEGE